MTAFIRCNGCGDELSFRGKPVSVEGMGTNGRAVSRIPVRVGEVFHWCEGCAEAAFGAVTDANRGAE